VTGLPTRDVFNAMGCSCVSIKYNVRILVTGYTGSWQWEKGLKVKWSQVLFSDAVKSLGLFTEKYTLEYTQFVRLKQPYLKLYRINRLLRFLRLEFTVQLQFSGMSCVECWKVSSVRQTLQLLF
jgi:hypothetical protein